MQNFRLLCFCRLEMAGNGAATESTPNKTLLIAAVVHFSILELFCGLPYFSVVTSAITGSFCAVDGIWVRCDENSMSIYLDWIICLWRYSSLLRHA